MARYALVSLEFLMVIAFGVGWLFLEWYCKRLDKPAAPASDGHTDAKTDNAD